MKNRKVNESIISYDNKFNEVLSTIESLSESELVSICSVITINPLNQKNIVSTRDSIIRDLKNIENFDIDTDITSISIPDSGDLLTFNRTNQRTGRETTMKENIKIGRFINKLFPGKYNGIQLDIIQTIFKHVIDSNKEVKSKVTFDDRFKKVIEIIKGLDESEIKSITSEEEEDLYEEEEDLYEEEEEDLYEEAVITRNTFISDFENIKDIDELLHKKGLRSFYDETSISISSVETKYRFLIEFHTPYDSQPETMEIPRFINVLFPGKYTENELSVLEYMFEYAIKQGKLNENNKYKMNYIKTFESFIYK